MKRGELAESNIGREIAVKLVYLSNKKDTKESNIELDGTERKERNTRTFVLSHTEKMSSKITKLIGRCIRFMAENSFSFCPPSTSLCLSHQVSKHTEPISETWRERWAMLSFFRSRDLQQSRYQKSIFKVYENENMSPSAWHGPITIYRVEGMSLRIDF